MVEDLTYLSYNKVLNNFEKLAGRQINHIITFLDWCQQLAYHWDDYWEILEVSTIFEIKMK